MFSKILIANRGEIACRVMRTARRLGVRTVAVYSDADRDALHVELADEAVHIGAAPSRESYLAGDKIIAAALRTGAQAIHPGYGFLSENAAFAQQVADAGLVFIGPTPAAIAAMGDKIASKKLALKAGVNTIPGWNAAIESPAQALQIARDIGYPVMVKASAGGGGKGLRVAWDDAQLTEAFDACRHEALASFGDDRVFIEKFIESPRHIEIQVLGDAHGHCIHLGERECSIQRRHQKLIEEAPSPFISEATRQAMGAQAVALARAVDYRSAGTVEFVVGADRRFYFLEMNTRLQVEHPVTEAVTGLDLVELMLRVAAGEPLPLTQAQVQRGGWAIECRINAEDPERGFLPSTGRLLRFEPPQGEGVRVDTGVAEGGAIPLHYDSMIAKLVVHGRDRAEAIARMRDALDGFALRGVQSNIAFQAAVLGHVRFAAGDFDTGFVADQFPYGFRAADVPHAEPDFLVVLAAAVHQRLQAQPAAEAPYVVLLHGEAGQWQHRPLRLRADGDALQIELDGRHHRVQTAWQPGALRVTGDFNAQSFTAQVDRVGLRLRLTHRGRRIEALVLTPRAAELWTLMPHKAPPDTSKLLLAPMPGLLAHIAVSPGQLVRAGEKLAVVEAMKMENILTAVQDATVAEILAEAGTSLAVDQPILRFE